jgi:hypothetical protein
MARREAVLPQLEQIFLSARKQGQLSFDKGHEAIGLSLNLLIGDQQVRQVTGRLPDSTDAFCDNRA